MKNKSLKNNDKIITTNWFNRWSNEYDRTLGSICFHRGLLDLVAKNARIGKDQKVLDIGCGTGLLSLKCLQRSPRCAITGIDYSQEMLSLFKNKIKKLELHDKVSVARMDAAALKFKDNTFDRAVSTVTLHHLKNKLPALKKVFRILKPGGILVIGEIDMDTTGKHTDTKRLVRILAVLEQEWIHALQDAGIAAFSKMFDNGKKHILNQGEYCLSLKQWAVLCRKAGFRKVNVKTVPRHKFFGIIIAQKALHKEKKS